MRERVMGEVGARLQLEHVEDMVPPSRTSQPVEGWT